MEKKNSDLLLEGRIALSVGDLIDKISVLAIKFDKLEDQREEISRDLRGHRHLRDRIIELKNLPRKRLEVFWLYESLLKNINEILWELEDKVRQVRDDEGRAARDCRAINSLRVQLKNLINEIFDCPREEKLYR